jgi:hypothetical protein
MNSVQTIPKMLCTLSMVSWLPLAAQDQPQPKINADAAIVQDFQKRVEDYHKLLKTIEQKLSTLKQTESQAMIKGHQEGIAASIREARQSAKRGDIFSPEIEREFRRLIAIAMQGGDSKRIKESLKHAEPVELQLRVNDSYPTKVPLQSTPPTLLLNLPKLPEELEYRLVGRSLVLRCGKGNLIVDFIPNVMPQPLK